MLLLPCLIMYLRIMYGILKIDLLKYTYVWNNINIYCFVNLIQNCTIFQWSDQVDNTYTSWSPDIVPIPYFKARLTTLQGDTQPWLFLLLESILPNVYNLFEGNILLPLIYDTSSLVRTSKHTRDQHKQWCTFNTWHWLDSYTS